MRFTLVHDAEALPRAVGQAQQRTSRLVAPHPDDLAGGHRRVGRLWSAGLLAKRVRKFGKFEPGEEDGVLLAVCDTVASTAYLHIS